METTYTNTEPQLFDLVLDMKGGFALSVVYGKVDNLYRIRHLHYDLHDERGLFLSHKDDLHQIGHVTCMEALEHIIENTRPRADVHTTDSQQKVGWKRLFEDF